MCVFLRRYLEGGLIPVSIDPKPQTGNSLSKLQWGWQKAAKWPSEVSPPFRPTSFNTKLSISKIKLETCVLNHIFRESLLKWKAFFFFFLLLQACLSFASFSQMTLEVSDFPQSEMKAWLKRQTMESQDKDVLEEETKSCVWGGPWSLHLLWGWRLWSAAVGTVWSCLWSLRRYPSDGV